MTILSFIPLSSQHNAKKKLDHIVKARPAIVICFED